jgi:hypothetical protein
LIAGAIKFKGKRSTPDLVWLIPVFFMAFFITKANFPFQSAETKKTLTYIKENIDPGERILITAPAYQSYQYYNTIGFVKFENPIILSKDWHFEEDFYEELKLLNGKVWLLFVDKTNRKSRKIIERLKKEDMIKLDYLRSYKSSAYLIDFGTKENSN